MTPGRKAIFGLVPPLAGLALFMGLAYLYGQHYDIYMRLLSRISIAPWAFPFLDGEYVFTMKKCSLLGYDIYKSIPCDSVPGNKMVYSPLWPRLPLPSEPVPARDIVGVVTDVLAILSPFILPRATDARQCLLLLCALVSPMVLFALERNNVDVWFYLLFCVAGLLLAKKPAWIRLLAYPLIMLAALLKYYPIVLFAMAARERLSTLLAVACVASLTLVVFVVTLWTEIAQSLANLPVQSPIFGAFGVTNLPTVLWRLLEARGTVPPEAVAIGVGAMRLALSAIVLSLAFQDARRPGFGESLRRMPARDASWLVMGGLLMAGCYLTGANLAYRGIFLLFVMTGLLAFERCASTNGMVRLAQRAQLLLPILMWVDAVILFGRDAQADTQAGWQGVLITVAWVLRELMWIRLTSLLIGVIIAFLTQTPLGGRALALVRGPKTQRASP